MVNCDAVAVLLLFLSVASGQLCLFGGSYSSNLNKCLHFFTAQRSWQDAKQICIDLGGRLTTIHSSFEQAFVTTTANKRFTTDYWIGLSDLAQKNVWLWEDGTQATFTNWNTGNPSTTAGDCVAAGAQQGKWHNADCAAKNNFVCEVLPDAPHKANQTAFCPGSSQTQNEFGKCFYSIKLKQSYSEASAICQAISGTLASVENVNQNNFVDASANTHKLDGNYWIGLRQDEDDFTWKWDDGSVSKYANWAQGYPSFGNGDCAMASVSNKQWMNAECSDNSNYFVCSTPGGWTYYNVTNAWYKNFGYEVGNWNAYERKCKQVGGHLASTHSIAESNFLNSFPGFPWIGLHCVNNDLQKFAWTDGTPLDFSQFPPGNHTDCCVRLDNSFWGTYDCNILYGAGVCKVVS